MCERIDQPAERFLIDRITNPSAAARQVPPDLVDAIGRHHLAPLAWDALTSAGCADLWPMEVQRALRRATAAQALASELLDVELRRVLDEAGGAGVRCVLIKGAALAYTHYRRPHLRPRGDSDVVIMEDQRDAMARALSALGYARSAAIEGSLITQQAQWTRELPGRVLHAVDVHWRVFNPHLFGAVLTPTELFSRAVPVPALGQHAWAPSTPDALVLACTHRVAHHAGEEDPIWDFDIHLLVSSLGDGQAAAFVRKATQGDVRAVCAAGITSARAQFGTRLPSELESFAAQAEATREHTAVFLEPGRRQVDLLTSDFGALRNWRARGALVRQHLFPSHRYILKKYGRSSPAWLPLLYTHRIVAGVPRWLRSQRS